MIVGPSLLDLRQQIDTSLTAISFTLTSRSAGYVIGSGMSEFYQLAFPLLIIDSCCSGSSVSKSKLPADLMPGAGVVSNHHCYPPSHEEIVEPAVCVLPEWILRSTV